MWVNWFTGSTVRGRVRVDHLVAFDTILNGS